METNQELIKRLKEALASGELSEDSKDLIIKELESLATKTLLDYMPHQKQAVFHTSASKVRFLSGGNRSGKTTSGTWEDACHATGIYPGWYPVDLRFKTPTRGRIIVTDFEKGGAVIEEKLFSFIPKDLIVDIRRTTKGALSKIEVRHVSGGTSVIEILTHEQDDMVFEGWNGHWAHFDEPPPREKFIATMRGLIDLRGRVWLTLTPINQPWLYDEFVSKANKGDKDFFFINVDMFDNPHTPLKEKEFFLKTLTEEEKEARIHGRFKHLTGLVYKMFDPDVHVVPKDKIKIDERWPVYFACDPHDRKKHVGIWARVDPLGNIYIIDEIHFGGTIEQFSKQVLMRELMSGIKPLKVIRILDPNKGRTPSAVTGLRLVDEFAKHALYFITSVNDDIALGHLAVSQKLSYNKSQPLSVTNAPKLFFIKENTTECVRYMQLYVWDDWKGSGKDTRTQKEKPQEKFKDFPDVIRYLVMYNPTWYDVNETDSDPIPYRSGSTTGYGR